MRKGPDGRVLLMARPTAPAVRVGKPGPAQGVGRTGRARVAGPAARAGRGERPGSPGVDPTGSRASGLTVTGWGTPATGLRRWRARRPGAAGRCEAGQDCAWRSRSGGGRGQQPGRLRPVRGGGCSAGPGDGRKTACDRGAARARVRPGKGGAPEGRSGRAWRMATAAGRPGLGGCQERGRMGAGQLGAAQVGAARGEFTLARRPGRPEAMAFDVGSFAAPKGRLPPVRVTRLPLPGG